MSQTLYGYECDVCDQKIVQIVVPSFAVTGIGLTLHCHDACQLRMLEAMSKNAWELLPAGKLRVSYREQARVLRGER